jgi:8-oxo-dGTP pyrophosphatase MutT (NUDIX family)
MVLLHTLIHPDLPSLSGKILERQAVRAIVLHEEDILLLFTKRYNDYSFPGGGLHVGEDAHLGLRRELEEETGARNVQILRHYGYVDEYRPHHKPEYDLMYMRSHFYVCHADPELGKTAMESYEHANGMTPHWINIHRAIEHNEQVIAAKSASMGLSIQRETLMLKQVVSELL